MAYWTLFYVLAKEYGHNSSILHQKTTPLFTDIMLQLILGYPNKHKEEILTMSALSHSTITQQPLLVQVEGSPNCQVTL